MKASKPVDLHRNFRRVGKNPFFRAKLLEAHHGRCARCRKPLAKVKWQAHHRTYDHACIYPEVIAVPVVYHRRDGETIGERHAPPCERCFSETPEAFAGCLAWMWPLCPGCHCWGEHNVDGAGDKRG